MYERVPVFGGDGRFGAAAIDVQFYRVGIDFGFVVSQNDGDRGVLADSGRVGRWTGQCDVGCPSLPGGGKGTNGVVVFQVVDEDTLAGIKVD